MKAHSGGFVCVTDVEGVGYARGGYPFQLSVVRALSVEEGATMKVDRDGRFSMRTEEAPHIAQ